MVDIQAEIDDVLQREGSAYTNRTSDRGGPTKYGITLQTWANYTRKPAVPADIENLTETDARACYLDLFWQRPGYAALFEKPPGAAPEDLQALAGLIFDSGVQHGTGEVTLWLQSLLGVKADWQIGPATIAAFGNPDPRVLYRRLLARRVYYYGEIVTNSPDQAVNCKGWLYRMQHFILMTP